jgi:hypothetical protein
VTTSEARAAMRDLLADLEALRPFTGAKDTIAEPFREAWEAALGAAQKAARNYAAEVRKEQT